MNCLISAAALIGVLLAAPLDAAERVSHGRFQNVTLYRPRGEVKAVVLFLSGDGGWNLGVIGMAQALVDQGAMVAGIDVPKLFANLEKDGGECVFRTVIWKLSHIYRATPGCRPITRRCWWAIPPVPRWLTR